MSLNLVNAISSRQFGRKARESLELSAVRAGMKKPRMAVSGFIDAAVVLFLAFFISGFVTLVFLFVPALGIALLALSLISLRAPSIVLSALAASRVKRIESELPFMLRYLSQLLEIGLTPEAALEQISRMESFSELSEVLFEALSEKQKGKLLENALSDLDSRLDSKPLSEAVSTIIQTLRLGSSPEALRITRRLAERMIEDKKREYLGFTAKSQVFLVVFIMLSAIVPAIIAFIVAFGGLMRPQGSAMVYAIFLVILPLVSIAELAFLKLNSPV